jgi:hypothetical protein
MLFFKKGHEPPKCFRDILKILDDSVQPNCWLAKLTQNQIREGVVNIVQERSSPIIFRNFRGLILRLFNRRKGLIKKDNSLTEFFAGNLFVDEKMEPNLDLVNTVLGSLAEVSDQRKQISNKNIRRSQQTVYGSNMRTILNNRSLVPNWRDDTILCN